MTAPRKRETEALIALVELVLMDPDPRLPEHDEAVIAAARQSLPWVHRATGRSEATGKPRAQAKAQTRWKADPPELIAGKKAVRERSRGICEHPEGCVEYAVHVHHIGGRVGTGAHSPSNLLDLCREHHELVHDQPEQSRANGTMVSRMAVSGPPVVDRRRS